MPSDNAGVMGRGHVVLRKTALRKCCTGEMGLRERRRYDLRIIAEVMYIFQ